MAQITTSKQFTLNWRDAANGFLVAAIGAVLTGAEQALSQSPVVFNWKSIALVGLGAGVSYLVKNFFAPSKTIITHTPPQS